MIALLDANMLIALLDAAHVHHQEAHEWLTANRSRGWATCPLTQNACLRVFSQPAYPGYLGVSAIARRLGKAVEARDHTFWPDTLSLCDTNLFSHENILGPRHLTDLYLLALAVENGGRLVTFDRSVSTSAVRRATQNHLVHL
jgi:toxin-antitoxin system PIN domain toxin